jgi:glucose/arabinose dehydrogenase
MTSLSAGVVLGSIGLLVATTPAMAVDRTFETEKAVIAVETVADGLDHPWGIDFLPDGRMIVTERPGRLRIITQGGAVSAPISGVPRVDARGQGGLLDVTLHPRFEQNRLVYLTYAEPGPNGTNSTAAARGRLSPDGTALTGVEVIFRQEPKVRSIGHFGSRVVFDGRGHIYITLGERFHERFRGQAQELDSLLGKVVRLQENGGIPPDNPFVGRPGARPEIWSYGHRNSQGAAINPETGRLWEIEHGPMGGDEINIPEPGANYGWPVVSFGVNYDGTPVGTGKKDAPGMADPIVTWTPVIAPGGMTFYRGAAFPEWTGNLLIGGLRSQAIVRLELDGQTVLHEERLLERLGMRIRDVAVGPGGAVYAITDETDGKILRITHAER